MRGKVIDLEQKRSEKASLNQTEDDARLTHLKLKLDLERARLAIPASILSIVVVVSVMNSRLLSETEPTQSSQLASTSDVLEEIVPTQSGTVLRGVASIPTGTSKKEDDLVNRLAEELKSGQIQAVGRKPTDLEKLALETLGGNYKLAVDPKSQKLISIEVLKVGSAIAFDQNLFLTHASVFPVAFDKAIRVNQQNLPEEKGTQETYQLVNSLSRPLAEVQIDRDEDGRLIRMRVQ